MTKNEVNLWVIFYLQGTIHPFLSTEKSFLHTASKEIRGIMVEKEVGFVFDDNYCSVLKLKPVKNLLS